MPSTPQPADLPSLLHRVFGHRDFRPHQQEVCEAAASGRDVLLVMPTGAGKSLCYQLPALARGNTKSGGTALVVSPLIALMDDQAHKLSALGLRVARIHSGLSRDDSRQACRDYLDGTLDFLFIAPERMRVPGFPEMLARRKPSLVAIDEAHCISQWGHDFRPDYRTLGQHLPALRPAPIIALTATATPTVQRDIATQLNLQQPAIFITGFRRNNLAVEVVELSKPQRADFALKLLQSSTARPAIIYAGSRKDAEEVAARLHKHFPTAAYHAGLDAHTRDRVQRAFLSSKLDVVVATVAFGMGIDKADVRTVIHVALPGSVEAFYQEIGRAGRDGQPSRTVLLHGFADRRLQDFLLERNYPPADDLERVARILPPTFTPVNDLHNLLRQKKDMMDRETLDRSIEKLLAAGVAQMDIAGNVKLSEDSLTLTTNQVPRGFSLGSHNSLMKEGVLTPAESATKPTWQATYQLQIAARRTQIDKMIAFAEATTCRMAALIAHFGDTTDTRPTCGLCDICNPSVNSASSAHQPNTEERRQLRTILRALEGRSTSTGKLFTDLKLTKHRDDFDTYLDALARAGLLTLTNDTFRTPDGKDITYKKAVITEEGHDPDDSALSTVWIRSGIADTPTGKKRKAVSSTQAKRSGETPGFGNAGSTSKSKGPLNPNAEALFEDLRTWRTEQAKPTKTPAFMVLADTVMRAIANANPQTLTELNAISGMGPSKVDRYGAAILAVCRNESTAFRDAQPTAKPLAPRTPSLLTPQQKPNPSHPSATLIDLTPPGAPHLASEMWVSTESSGNSHKAGAANLSHLEIGVSTKSAANSPKANPAPTYNVQRTTSLPPTNLPLTPAQALLDTRLRDWRKQAAATAGLPTFFILSDTALRSITLSHPRTLEDLRHVKGIDPDKLIRFGPEVLSCCNP